MASRKLLVVVAMGFILSHFPIAVHAEPLQTEENRSKAEAVKTDEGFVGTAFYYAKRYNGRKTNSGVRYDPAKMTAAHPSLPHGTRVKVINLANKQEVVVTINDRCKKRKKPVIDLSRAAAGKLGFLGKGTARVRIIPLAQEAT